MIYQPANVQDLARWLAAAHARGVKATSIDLCALTRVVEYTPEDMTVTVEGGITLTALQNHLSSHGQWLPIDPPNPQALIISEILNGNLSGPRRFGCGTIRDHLIGLKFVLADGRVIKSGGKVVKNVAGYDLQKLFVGSRGSLGVIVEATFKLRPLPEAEQFLQAHCASLERAGELIESILESEVTPVVLDLHQLSTLNSQLSTLLGFAGTREEVEWQVTEARELGFTEPTDLGYEKGFWIDPSPTHRLSVLPSKTVETIRGLGAVSFLARAGDGVIYYRGGTPPAKTELPMKLLQCVKDAYDPKHILPELPI